MERFTQGLAQGDNLTSSDGLGTPVALPPKKRFRQELPESQPDVDDVSEHHVKDSACSLGSSIGNNSSSTVSKRNWASDSDPNIETKKKFLSGKIAFKWEGYPTLKFGSVFVLVFLSFSQT